MIDPSRVRIVGALQPFATGFAAELVRQGYRSGSQTQQQSATLGHVSQLRLPAGWTNRYGPARRPRAAGRCSTNETAERALSARLSSGSTSPRSGSRIRKRPLTVAVWTGAGASAIVAAPVDVAACSVLRLRGTLSWSRRRRAGRRLAEDDAPATVVVPVAVEGLPAQGAGPLDERRQCGQHDAREGPALLGFGERDSAGLLLGERGPKRAVVMAALGGGQRLVVGAAMQDPQGGPRHVVDRVVAGEPAEQAAACLRTALTRLRLRSSARSLPSPN